MRFPHAQTSGRGRRAWLRDIYSTPRSLHFSAAARAPNQESGHILGWSWCGGGGGFCVLLGIRSYIPGPVSRWSTAGPTVCGPEGTTASLPD